MQGHKWMWTLFVLLTCWILPFLHATRKKRHMASFSKTVLHVLSTEYSNIALFNQILDPILIERVSGTNNNAQVQMFIEEQMSGLGWTITKDRFMDQTPIGVKSFTNIIATFDPRAASRLVLVCHFDSKYMSDGSEFLAATDSAVPCAMMIDLARNLDCLLKKSAASDVIPSTTLQLIFLDGEEAFDTWSKTDSTYGARHLAQLWSNVTDPHDSSKNMLQTITDFVLLDLIGSKDVQFKNMYLETSRLYEKLYEIERKLDNYGYLDKDEHGNYRPYFANQPNFRHLGIEDDHLPFFDRGVNILHLISVPFPTVWHQLADNKQALDFTSIDNFNRILRVFVASYLHLDATKNSCRRK